MSIKIKVGSLILTEARDESIPQEFAAWHQTVQISPGTYDVFAYLSPEGGTYHVRQLSAPCEGITVSSDFRAHMFGVWGASDHNRNGQPATVHVRLPTSGLVDAEPPALLAQATLCDALVRSEWDPREIDPRSTFGRMWRFTWNRDRRPIVIERSRYGSIYCLAAFEDLRRFRVDDAEMVPGEISELEISFQDLRDIDHLTVNETAVGWSWSQQKHLKVTRLV